MRWGAGCGQLIPWPLLVFLCVSPGLGDEAADCPHRCTCTRVHNRDLKPPQSPFDRVKAKCGVPDSPIFTLDVLTIESFRNTSDLTHLDLSGNNLTFIPSKALNLPELLKLDLNRNHLEVIEDGAFSLLTSLKKLDLSNNKISHISRAMFEGLIHLDRLKLSQNLIVEISEGTFDGLHSLKQLDLTANPLLCDCKLWWVGVWSRNASIKLTPIPKCSAPPALKGQPLKKLYTIDQGCIWKEVSSSPLLELNPSNNQVVFEGDSLRLECRAGQMLQSQNSTVTWYWAGLPPQTIFPSVLVENKSITNDGLLESSLVINHLESNHTGEWNCELVSSEGNHTSTISVVVISEVTKYCPPLATKDEKGEYSWPKTVAGHVVELPCQFGTARHNCTLQGTWAALNTSTCQYISETTRVLQHYSRIELTSSRSNVMETASRFFNYTLNIKDHLKYPVDIVFIAQTLTNFLEYVPQEQQMAPMMLSLVNVLMDLDSNFLSRAQLEDHSCSKLLRVLEIAFEHTPSILSNKWSMNVTRDSFSGVICSWWENKEGQHSILHPFYCSTAHKSAAPGMQDRMLGASIQVPGSLFHTHAAPHGTLLISAFKNTNLFPTQFNSSRIIVSPIIGAKLVDSKALDIPEPVHIVLRMSGEGVEPLPVWWDESIGEWVSGPCNLTQLLNDHLFLLCHRLGYFSLLAKTPITPLIKVEQMVSRFSPPGIYAGTFVSSTCLLVAAFSYAICQSSIQMSDRMKHSLANLWVAISLLSLTFCLGIFQTHELFICQGIGLFIHYLSLCSLFWMAVCINSLHRCVSKSEVVSTPSEEGVGVEVVGQPLVGLYLVGWGISALLVGLSGAVNPKGYATPRYCFLGPGPGFTPVIVPVSALLIFILTRVLMVRSAAMEKDSNGQLSEDTQATDLELLETGVPVGDRASVHSIITPSSSLEDPEHPPYLQLKAFVIVLCLFCFVWVSGALTILSPLDLPYEEMVFSVLYAFFITTLGIFVVFFYCFSRNDVRGIWFTLKPIVRSRNVMDVQPNPPVITSRSSVSSSMGLKSPTPLDQQAEPPKPNFVDLYRRQYHSQSVVAVEPNAFYNPHQSIVARKFFKKQRRKQNGLGARRSGDGATPISPDTSELFHPKMNGEVLNDDLGGRPLERLVIGAERNEPTTNDSVKYASVVSECCSCMVSEAHSATDCTRDITSEHSSRSSHLYATVAPDMSPVRNKHSRLLFDRKNEMVRMKVAQYQDSKGNNEDKHETCL